MWVDDKREFNYGGENRTDDVSSEAHGVVADDTAENAKGTDVQEYQVGAEEVDVADVSNQESKGLKRRGEQFLEVRKVLETLVQETGTARGRQLVRRSVLEAEPAAANSASRERELSAWVSREQDPSKAKENLNNLDTKALGGEVISSCASRYATIPAITLRGVVVAILVRTINVKSNEFENGCHLKQAKDTKMGVASSADSVSMFMTKCWSRRSSRENKSVWSRRMRPSAEAQSSARDRKSKRVRVRSIVYSVRTDGRDRERFTTRVLHKSQTKACQASSVECSDKTWRNASEAGVDRPP